jgi:hypothetical protein
LAGRTVAKTAVQHGFRSGLEEAIAEQLTQAGIPFEFEAEKVPYITPATPHKYTWDFRLPNGIIIESKGRFLTEDRRKHLLIKEQHPELDIRFVFTRSKSTISKTSKTSYADWCLKYGFQYADKWIPEAWLKEPPK